MRPLRLLVPALILLLAAARPLSGQSVPSTSMEGFVHQVARLWGSGEAAGLSTLLPAGERLELDTGSGTEAVNARHAAAALRALFSDRETVSVRPVRVAAAEGQPDRGFGELAWSYRTRGVSSPQVASVYVGVVWQDSHWRVTEVRILP